MAMEYIQHGTPVDAGLWITQVGSMDGRRTGKWMRSTIRFQCVPDADDADGVSCFAGKLSVDDAVTILAMGSRPVLPDDIVRYASAGELLAKGFTLTHTPPPKGHVSVKVDGVWDDSHSEAFNACFLDIALKDGNGG